MSKKPFFEHDCDHCTFLGTHTDDNGKCDLYYHPPSKRGYGETLIARYSDEPSDYASGIDFAYIADMKKEYNSHYYIALKKAVKMGVLEEKEYFVGYSETMHDEEYEKYFDTDFYKNKPKNKNFEMEPSIEISDEDWDKNEDDYDKKNENYEKEYYKNHNEIPSSPDGFLFVFDNKEDMLKYCKKGNFSSFMATSNTHALRLMESSNCKDIFFKKTFLR